MKFLMVLFILMSSLAFGQEASFKDKVYPLLKKSPLHLILFTHFDFHPSFVIEQKDDKSHSITTLVSYSPEKTGSITWSHFVIFHLSKNGDKEVIISSIEFRDTGVNKPCFVPKEVVSVDGVGNLSSHKVSIDSQPLMPMTKQFLQQLQTKKK